LLIEQPEDNDLIRFSTTQVDILQHQGKDETNIDQAAVLGVEGQLN